MSTPFDGFRGAVGSDFGIGMKDVIQLVKDQDVDIGFPTFDAVRPYAIHSLILPALENRTVLIGDGRHELPLSCSVKAPVSDIFSALCWLFSVTRLNKIVRTDDGWYRRGLAMMTIIFKRIFESLGITRAFPYCVVVIMSADSCFSPDDSGIAHDGHLHAMFACSLPATAIQGFDKPMLIIIRGKSFLKYAPEEARLYVERAPQGDRLFNCGEALAILSLTTVRPYQTIHVTAIRVEGVWAMIEEDPNCDLDAVVEFVHMRLCRNCRYQMQVNRIQCLDHVKKVVYPVNAASESANMGVQDLEGWRTLCSCENPVAIMGDKVVCPQAECTMVWCSKECLDADEGHIQVCEGIFGRGKKLRTSRMLDRDL
ncbi:hypothetical protein BD410DRAFT_781797 [Rickenella mellea]|uniref:Uncharacterized protein n=1 Tax=Rickenella mellea TaxID=50990 RepID=A0A4Y7QLB5_9AGAM|nr:hypothetical protein BD410DRAFT_781797 [Rickenella mellea]